MIPERGASLQAWLGAIAAVIVVALFLRWAFRSDAQILSDAIDEARDALVEKRDDDFLAFFSPEVTYQGRGDAASLRRDLARWHAVGISEVFVVSREIDLDGDEADIRLVVVVGPELLRIDVVNVDLEAEKDAGGEWRVRAFSWKRP